MISCLSVSGSRPGLDGIYLTAELMATEKPDPMPLTGEDIEGMEPSELLDAGSRLLILSDGGSEWILGQDRTWYEQKKSGAAYDGSGSMGWPTPEEIEKAWLDAREDPQEVYHELRPVGWPEIQATEDDPVVMLVRLAPEENSYTHTVLCRLDTSAVYQVQIYRVDGSSASLIQRRSGSSVKIEISRESLAADPGTEVLFKIVIRPEESYSRLSYIDFMADVAEGDETHIVDLAVDAPEAACKFLAAYDGFTYYTREMTALRFLSFYARHIENVAQFSTSDTLGPIPSSVEVVTRMGFSREIHNSPYRSAGLLRCVPDIGFDISSFSGLFSGCAALQCAPRIPGIRDKGASDIFNGCRSLKAVSPDAEITLESAQYMDRMLMNCESLTIIPRIIAPNATRATGLIAGCGQLRFIDLTLGTDAVSISALSSGCEQLRGVRLRVASEEAAAGLEGREA